MKKITSLTLGISFLIMSYTGIMLFLCPHGRVAYWSDWHLLGLSKDQYGNLHTTSMIVFVVFGVLHIWYNWKAILSYLRNSSRRLSFTKKEFIAAIIINAAVMAGTLLSIQPFSGFLAFEEKLKESWTKRYGEPPYGHAEESKLKVLCRKEGIDLESARQKLNNKQILHDPEMTLKEIAAINRITPNKIYTIIAPKPDIAKKKTDSEKPPSRLGRKTLEELHKKGKIEIKNALELLRKRGVKNPDAKSRMKNLADELDMTPVELYELLVKSSRSNRR